MERFDTGINTKFMDYIDVPASSKKDFKLAFYAYKESFTTMKVSILWEKNLKDWRYDLLVCLVAQHFHQFCVQKNGSMVFLFKQY